MAKKPLFPTLKKQGKKGKRPKTIQEIELALIRSGGFISHAAELLGIAHSSVCERIRRSDHLQTVMKEIKESYLDLAETALISRLKKEDLGAICFYLKCQGKGRGYIERQEIAHGIESGSGLNIKIEFVD